MTLSKIQSNVPLSGFCTFGIGGPAEHLVEVTTIDAMVEVLHFCHEHHLSHFILGKGSNCLFDDRGFKGMVIVNKIDFCMENEPGRFFVGAGHNFSLLGTRTARDGWSGLEFACGIPGTVGGAVFMNAGANGRETKDSLASVQYVENGEVHTYPREELAFSYRHSPFQTKRGAIVAATFALEKSSEARPKQLQIIETRKKTQPLRDKSAGCIFRNPIGNFAGALIEKVGLKGFSMGGAKISEIHANFIVNAGSATSQEIQALIRHVVCQVKEKEGIQLESEVRLVPYELKE